MYIQNMSLKPSSIGMPTFLSQWPTKMAVDAGSNLSLSCQIDEPSGSYSVMWHKDDNDLAANRYTKVVLNGKCIYVSWGLVSLCVGVC